MGKIGPKQSQTQITLRIFIITAFSVDKSMMTSSNGNIFRVTGHLCGEFTGLRWIPRTKASDAELWCFLWFVPDKRLSKQSWGWWFETQSGSLWRHSNVILSFPKPGIKYQYLLTGIDVQIEPLLLRFQFKSIFSGFFSLLSISAGPEPLQVLVRSVTKRCKSSIIQI